MRIARLDCHSAIVLLLDRQEEKLCVPTNNVGSWPLNVAGRFTGCKTLQMVAGSDSLITAGELLSSQRHDALRCMFTPSLEKVSAGR
jgi:hypothetical protein